jgi:hypothetical protein
MVMSHELTHALEDQQYQIEDWVKAARPNDDAELARESVLEGSAMAAMLDYMLREKGLNLRDLPDIDPSVFVGDMSETPMLKKAPPFIKDSLMFPYFAGLTFSSNILKTDGWSGFESVFAKPPANTQQIMHPDLYRAHKVSPPLKLGLPEHFLDATWVPLEENSLGEFGWKEVLKQFLDEDRAKSLAAAWDGDKYTTYEQKDTKRTLLVTHVRLASEEVAARFFGQYSEALEKKHSERTNLYRHPNFFSFTTPDGGVLPESASRWRAATPHFFYAGRPFSAGHYRKNRESLPLRLPDCSGRAPRCFTQVRHYKSVIRATVRMCVKQKDSGSAGVLTQDV